MQTRYFALVFGIFYTIVGIAGFIPQLVQEPPPGAPDLAVNGSYGYLFGLFPVNILHNIVHVLVGLLGIAAFANFPAARWYSRALLVVFGLLAIMGLIPDLMTTFGLIPLFGHDVWLHALTALAGGYFGFLAPEERASSL
jgi:hypothetical protein